MKKISLLLAILLCALSCACGAAEAISDGITAEPLPVDLDLSQMSGTIVYAEVFHMMMEPEAYIGKVIRLSGWYDAYEDKANGMVYTACIIPDATACCAQGIEFVWAGEHQYPQDYPVPGTNLIVTGRFETYTEYGCTFIHLTDAEIVWLPEDNV